MPPDLVLDIPEIQFSLSDDGVKFEPAAWKLVYSEYNGAGVADGQLKWTPTLAADLSFSTDPVSLRQWKDIRASGKVKFDNGVLRISDFRAQQGDAEVTATAALSDKQHFVMASWKRLKLDPAGLPATSNGTMTLQWKASDFSDAGGSGTVALDSQYGNVQSDVQIQNARALLKLSAKAPDATATATLTTGLDQKINGSFQASYKKYGDVTARGHIKGSLTAPLVDAHLQARGITYQDIGPLNGSADASLRNNVVVLENVRADLKQSTLKNATARVDLRSRQIEGQITEVLLHIEDVASEASGVATLSAELSGSLDKPAASFRGSSAGLKIGETQIDSAQVEGRLENDIVVLDRIEATQTDGRLAATGTLNIRTREVGANFNIDNLAIKNIHGLSTTAFLNGGIGGGLDKPSTDFKGELRDVVYEGEPHGNIVLSGSTAGTTATVQARSETYSATLVSSIELRSPYTFTATVIADKSRIRYQQYEAVVSGKTEAAGQAQPFKVDRLTVQNLTASGNGVDLKANGNLEDGIRADIVADLSQVPVDGLTLTGTATANAVLTGTIEHPVVDGTIDTRNATVRTPQMAEAVAVTTSVSFEQNQYEIRKMRADIAGGHIDIQGHGVLQGPASLKFHAEDIHPEAFLRDRPVSGIIAADGTASLTGPSLEGASGEAKVSQFNLIVRDTEIHQTEPVRVS
jgi:autotransporter translocation and assembly factor TamB